jgi:probable phosphoglycerate mutase
MEPRGGRHTSRTDISLTESGEARASGLRPTLADWQFGLVLCSPRLRAVQTCDLIGWGQNAVKTEDLSEWNYGAYEGLTRGSNPRDRAGLDSLQPILSWRRISR